MVFMKVQEKMKIGIFQPNINHYPSIENKLTNLKPKFTKMFANFFPANQASCILGPWHQSPRAYKR